jgi:HK97 family phage portal protein
MNIITRARKSISNLIAPKRSGNNARPDSIRQFFVGPTAQKATWSMYKETTDAGEPIPAIFQNYSLEGFSGNALIYSAIMYKVRASYSAPLRAYSGTPLEPQLLPPEHPISKILARPNGYQSWSEFMGLNIVYQNLSGNAFILIGRDRNGTPNALYPLRPDRVTVVSRDVVEYDANGMIVPREIVGYAYTPAISGQSDTVLIDTSDIIHVLFPNALDAWQGMGRGLSPIMSMAKSGDVDNKVTSFLKAFFDRGAMFSGILQAPEELDEVIVARIRDRFQEIYGGYENWPTIPVLDASMSYTRIGLSFDEMGFESIDRRNASRVLMPFGVPGILINEPSAMERSTYNNFQEARRVFWEDTLKPELTAYQDQFQYALNSDDIFVEFDFTGVPALSRDIPALIAAANTAWGMGVPADVAFRMVGIDIPSYPGSDTAYIAASVVSVGKIDDVVSPQQVAQPKPDDTQTAEDDGAPENITSTSGLNGAQINAALEVLASMQAGSISQGTAIELLIAMGIQEERAAHIASIEKTQEIETQAHKFNAHTKQLLWKQSDDIATSFEERYAQEAIAQFTKDEAGLLARTKALNAIFLERKQTVVYQELMFSWKQYLDMAGERWKEAFIPLIEATILAQGNAWKATYGIEFDVHNLFSEQWFDEYILTFSRPIMQTTEADLSTILQTAEREGWSVAKIQSAIGVLFNQYKNGGGLTPDQRTWFDDRTPAYRTENIARTETLRASNAGSFHLFSDWGAPMKEWIATADDRTREDHMKTWQEYSEGGNIGPIPINEPFMVGGYRMMYPHDAQFGAPPGQFCNCRCSMLPYGDFANV